MLRAPPTKKPATSITSATRTTISTSGNDPHGRRRALVLDRPARRGAAARRRGAAAAASRRGASAGGGRRGRGLRRFLPSAQAWRRSPGAEAPRLTDNPRRAGPATSPSSIPRMPQRGRECQCRQPRLADVLVGDDHPAVALGLGDHRLEQAAVGLLDVGAAAELGPGVAQAQRRARRGPARARRSPSTRGPPTRADAPLDPAAREGRGEQLAELALERARSGAAGRRGRAARRSAAAAAGGARRRRGRGASASVCSSSSGTADPPAAIADVRDDSNPAGRRRPARAPPRPRSSGTPADLDRDQHRPLGLRPHAAPAAGAPNSSESGRSSSAITSVPAGSSPGRPSSSSPGGARPDPERARDAVGVEGAQGDAATR